MKKLAILLAGAIVPIGLGACAAPAHPLPCTAVAGAATQGGSEVVAVHSVGGAGVLARASYRHAAPGALTSTNAAGLGHVSFPVPDAGYSVKVTVITVKGHQIGSCAAYFTPTRKVATPKPPSKPVAPVKPPTKPPTPTGPQSVTCNDVNFPALQPEFIIPHHSYGIQATDSDCLTARALATLAQGYHGQVNDTIYLRANGFSCKLAYVPNSSTEAVNLTCTNPVVPDAKITFTYAQFPVTQCAESNPQVTGVIESNSDCSFAVAVANAGYPNNNVTFGQAAFSADGFSCQQFYPGGTDAQILDYQCFTPDNLSMIFFKSIE